MIDRVDRPGEQLIDEILVMDCQSGRAKALEKLVSRWQKRLWRYAYRLTGNSDAAWDITQESWLSIIKGIGKLHDPARFRSWAYRIVTNKTSDWIRKRKTAKSVAIDKTQVQQTQGQDDAGLKELLEKLDMRKRAVLSLYHFEQLSVGEISTALGIPKGTVKSRLHAARKELRELWQQQIK
ncbi:MAG: RNA polymerase sigma factor [Sedimentisphaerales bacterium]